MNTLLRRSLPGNRILSAEAVDNAACARRRVLERVTDYGILVIDKAKFLLVERKRMTEEEAHRYIGKQAMNHGISRKRIAQQILDDE